MSLHEFMTEHRAEILNNCYKKLRDDVIQGGSVNGVDQDLEQFFDEVIHALRNRQSERPPAQSKSDAAARLGQEPQRAGLEPGKVPLIFGAISSAIGETGENCGLCIDADEYRVFNQCIDSGVATSIENFWNGERAERERRDSQRFGDLAHELRSALGNAATAFKLLKSSELPLTGRTASVLANNLIRMEALLARTLGAERLEPQVALELTSVGVAGVLRQLQASAIPDRAISVTLAVDDSLHITADHLLLTSAVSNLLQNAIRFSRAGACVMVSCWTDNDEGVIEVEDECGGLLEDVTDLISGESPGSDGASQGLAITRRAVEAMNGSLRIENRAGHGCSFLLSFPLARPTQRSSQPPPTPR